MSRELPPALNVLGQPLQPCSFEPLTGWFRDGCCNTDRTSQSGKGGCTCSFPGEWCVAIRVVCGKLELVIAYWCQLSLMCDV